jgi:GlcNAc-P-P-Und epimerase
LITGAAGFIGGNLVAAGVKAGMSVCAIDVRQKPAAMDGVSWRTVDLLDADALKRVFTAFRPDAVVHLGARTELDETVGLAAYLANTEGVGNVIAAVQATGSVSRVIWASTRRVFAIDHEPRSPWDYKPSTQYGVSKVVGEVLVCEALPRLPLSTIVRPTSIWGPGFEEPYHPFFKAVLSGRYVHPRRVDPAKTFGYVENTCHQLLRLATATHGLVHGEVLMLADYEDLNLRQWADFIAQRGGAPPIREVPIAALRAAAAVGDRVKSDNWPLSTFRLKNLITDMRYDTSRLRELVPELPFSWQDGVDRTLAWMRS